MSVTRHPRIDGLIESVNDAMQRLLHCNIKIRFLTAYLIYPFYFFNCSTNESLTHFLFEVCYEHRPTALADRLWPVIDAPNFVVDRIFDLSSIWNVDRGLVTLSKQCMTSRSSRLASTFVLGDLAFLSPKVYIFIRAISVLTHSRLLKKLAWNRTSLNNLVNAGFILFEITFCFLRNPILISKFIKMNYK
jgi:hypothetical protein